MTEGARPYCSNCHSGFVKAERDPEDGMLIVRCFKCGNEATPISDPERKRFYMANEDEMAKKGTCGNCGRQNVSLISGGHCWSCYSAVRGKERDTEEYDIALAEVKKTIQSGNLRNWGRNKKVSAIPELRKTPSETKASDPPIRTLPVTPGGEIPLYFKFYFDFDVTVRVNGAIVTS